MAIKIKFIFRNLADSATITASPALVTGLPESNLKFQERNKTARSTSTAAQTFSFSWAADQNVDAIGIKGHNLTAAATLAAPTYSDSAFTTAIDTNAAANCFAYTGFDANDVLTEADFRIIKNAERYLTNRTNVRSMKATLADASNPDGYIEASRIFIGKSLELSYSVPYGGAILTLDDLSVQSVMDDGSLITDKRAKRRKLELSAHCVAPSEWAALLAGMRYAGLDKDIWVSVFPDDGTYLQAYYSGAFKFAAPSAFDRHFPGAAQSKLTLIET